MARVPQPAARSAQRREGEALAAVIQFAVETLQQSNYHTIHEKADGNGCMFVQLTTLLYPYIIYHGESFCWFGDVECMIVSLAVKVEVARNGLIRDFDFFVLARGPSTDACCCLNVACLVLTTSDDSRLFMYLFIATST